MACCQNVLESVQGLWWILMLDSDVNRRRERFYAEPSIETGD